MNDDLLKEPVFKRTLEALGKTEAGQRTRKYANKKLSDLGIDKKEMALLISLAKAAKDKELEYEFKHKNWRFRPRVGKDDVGLGIHLNMEY